MLSVAVACEPTTGPDKVTLDPDAALADYKAMQEVFASDGWAGFRALGGRTPLSASVALTQLGALGDAHSPHTARSFATNLFSSLAANSPAGQTLRESVISSVHLGKTLAYNVAADRYVIDASRTGAPANGTRFILYEVGANGKPIVSQEIGYADLLDEGAEAGGAVVLRLVAVARGHTLLDYRLRAEPQGSGGRIDVNGFLAGENGARLDFTIGAVGTVANGQSTVDLTFELAMAQRHFDVSGSVNGVDGAANGEGVVELDVRHGDNTLRVEMTGEAGELDGAIHLNGQPFVTVTGSAMSPVLRNAAGLPLTGPELLLVLSIVDTADNVFDLVEDLLRPVDNLLLLGWIL
jgi:hypothetical protein